MERERLLPLPRKVLESRGKREQRFRSVLWPRCMLHRLSCITGCRWSLLRWIAHSVTKGFRAFHCLDFHFQLQEACEEYHFSFNIPPPNWASDPFPVTAFPFFFFPSLVAIKSFITEIMIHTNEWRVFYHCAWKAHLKVFSWHIDRDMTTVSVDKKLS